MVIKTPFLLGTTNPAKVSIVRAALAPLPIDLLTPADLSLRVDLREDGRSTAENAERKARAYFAQAHLPTLAIDGGLRIEGLPEDKQPGLFVRRIHGPERETTDADVLDHYARELAGIGGQAIGLWQGSLALILSDERLHVETYTYRTLLTSRPKGGVTPGAPLDALTIDPATGRYLTELAWSEHPDARWIFEFVKRIWTNHL